MSRNKGRSRLVSDHIPSVLFDRDLRRTDIRKCRVIVMYGYRDRVIRILQLERIAAFNRLSARYLHIPVGYLRGGLLEVRILRAVRR